jgi:hypothetical protein
MSGVRVTHEEIDRPGMRKKRNSAARRRRVARSIKELALSRVVVDCSQDRRERIQ